MIHIDEADMAESTGLSREDFEGIIRAAMKVVIEEKGGEFRLTKNDFLKTAPLELALKFEGEDSDGSSEAISIVTYVSGVKQ
jgi:hypothetical protein